MTIQDKINSMRTAVNADYNKPSESLISVYQEALFSTTERANIALEYLRSSRGFNDDTIKRFKLGYDHDRDAISIPIFKGPNLINFKYRYLNPDNHGGIKYGSVKGAEPWVFNDTGFAVGMSKGRILICEGEFDTIAMYNAGYRNVVGATGKDSYKPWLDKLDSVAKVYIVYDNDKPGQQSANELAERIGIEKTFMVNLPDNVKDVNEFFLNYPTDYFRTIANHADPAYNKVYVNLSSILDDLRTNDDAITSPYLPDLKLGKDWLVILSGPSNAGKTTTALNIAIDFARRNIPTLIMPFERGNTSVGKRALQVMFNMQEEEFSAVPEKEWEDMKNEARDIQLYFTVPKLEESAAVVKLSKKLFGTRVVIIDHLDYLCRMNGGGNKNDITGEVLQDLKALAMETNTLFIVVHHIRKLGKSTAELSGKSPIPTMEDLKGSSSVYQDPETVIMLYPEKENEITVDIQKNKGKMSKKSYVINHSTGKIFTGDEKKNQKNDPRSISDKIFDEL